MRRGDEVMNSSAGSRRQPLGGRSSRSAEHPLRVACQSSSIGGLAPNPQDSPEDEMSAQDTAVQECRHFIGGEWAGSADGRTFEDRDPFTGEVVAHVAAGGREDARKAVDAAAAAFGAWSQAGPGQRQAIFLKAADLLEARAEEVVGWLARETGCSFGFGMFQMGFVPGLFRQAAGAAYSADRHGDPVGPAGRVCDGRSPAGRRGGGDRALERGADPVGALDRGAARVRQHGGAQALGGVALLRRAAVGRDLRRGRAAGRRPEHRHARALGRRGRRQRAGREPGRAADQLHGLDGHRPQAGRGGRAQPEARRARAGRAEPADRARRCRPRLRRVGQPPSAPTCTRARSACRRAGSSCSGRWRSRSSAGCRRRSPG